MIGLDTNALVRYLTLDDPHQSPVAVEVIEAAARSGPPLFVSAVVLCELVWVLDRAYSYRKGEIVEALEALLRVAHIRYIDPVRLWGALADYRDGDGDFADYLIGREGSDQGCQATVTFDRALEEHPAFRMLGSREP